MKSFKLLFIFLGYIFLSLIFGEEHPFTKVPMYANFPNWAYSFYITDSNNILLPVRKYFSCANDELSHQYSAICERLKINYGNQSESGTQLDSIGAELIVFLKSRQVKPLPVNQIQLTRVCYSISQNKISQKEVKLFYGNWTN
jgi:hypothetical protein